MNDLSNSLARLGESLAEEFQLRLSEWTTAESLFHLPETDLGILSSAEDEMQRWQAEGSTWLQLDRHFTSDFIPADLLTPGSQTPPEPEDSDATMPFRQFASRQTGRSGAPGNSALSAPIFAGQKTAPHDGEEPGEQQNSNYPEKESTGQPLEAPYKTITGQPENSAANYFAPDLSDAATSSLQKNPGVFDSQPAQDTPPGAEPTTNKPAGLAPPYPSADATPPDSFWNQPLQGLGDFVTRYEQEPKPVSTAPAGKKPEPQAGMETPPAQQESNPAPGKRQVPGFGMPSPEDWLYPQPEFQEPDKPVLPPALIQNTFEPPENQGFTSVSNPANLSRLTPDTDDILDELTQRIIRDFRRFYP